MTTTELRKQTIEKVQALINVEKDELFSEKMISFIADLDMRIVKDELTEKQEQFLNDIAEIADKAISEINNDELNELAKDFSDDTDSLDYQVWNTELKRR